MTTTTDAELREVLRLMLADWDAATPAERCAALAQASRRATAAEALGRVFAAAQRSVDEGMDPGEAIRRHIAAVKASHPAVYDLIVRESAADLIRALNTADGLADRTAAGLATAEAKDQADRKAWLEGDRRLLQPADVLRYTD